MRCGNRARAWLEKKEVDKSLADFDQAVQLRDPNEKTLVLHDIELSRGADSSRMVNVGSLLLSERCRAWTAKGDYEKALADAAESIRLEPSYESPFRHRRTVWERQGEWQKAATELEANIKAGAPTLIIMNEYARLRATCPVDKLRNGREAVKLATQASAIAVCAFHFAPGGGESFISASHVLRFSSPFISPESIRAISSKWSFIDA